MCLLVAVNHRSFSEHVHRIGLYSPDIGSQSPWGSRSPHCWAKPQELCALQAQREGPRAVVLHSLPPTCPLTSLAHWTAGALPLLLSQAWHFSRAARPWPWKQAVCIPQVINQSEFEYRGSLAFLALCAEITRDFITDLVIFLLKKMLKVK